MKDKGEALHFRNNPLNRAFGLFSEQLCLGRVIESHRMTENTCQVFGRSSR